MWLALHQTVLNGDVVRSACSVQGHPCIYPGHVAIPLKVGQNSAGCVSSSSFPPIMRSHYQVVPSDSLGLGDSVVTCSDGSFIAGTWNVWNPGLSASTFSQLEWEVCA